MHRSCSITPSTPCHIVLGEAPQCGKSLNDRTIRAANITIPQSVLHSLARLSRVTDMRSSSSHRLVDLLVASLVALTISISAVAGNNVPAAMGATDAVSSMTQDGGCKPIPPMPGCAKAGLCELACMTSALTVPPEPFHFAPIDELQEAPAWVNSRRTGIASPLDPSPPRMIDIA